MSQPWQAQCVVTPEAAQQLIDKQFPDLAPSHATELGEGFDNTVYQVNQDYVFRFPRREMSVELLETEGRLLPALSEVLPLAVPRPLYYGEPDFGYSWPFIGSRLIKGIPPEQIPAAHRSKAAKPLAEFLRALHSFPIDQAIHCGVPSSDTIKRMDVAYRLPQVKENMAKAEALGLIPDPHELKRYISTVEIVETPPQKALVHGDLHIRNFLVDQEGYVTGIIDWGDTHIGHPAVDLAIAYSYLPPEGRQEFFETYGQVDTRVKELARFRAIHLILVLMLYGHDQGHERLVKAVKESLQLALVKEEGL